MNFRFMHHRSCYIWPMHPIQSTPFCRSVQVIMGNRQGLSIKLVDLHSLVLNTLLLVPDAKNFVSISKFAQDSNFIEFLLFNYILKSQDSYTVQLAGTLGHDELYRLTIIVIPRDGPPASPQCDEFQRFILYLFCSIYYCLYLLRLASVIPARHVSSPNSHC